MAHVVLAGTFDSKGLEYSFVRDEIAKNYPQCQIILIDIGYVQDPNPTVIVPNITAAEIALKAGCKSIQELRDGEREAGYKIMSKGLTLLLKDMYDGGKLHGILGLGGTCGSSMLTAVMRELPIGLPKIMVSTAAGTAASLKYFGLVDLILINCVTDICGGVNSLNRETISNAAVAIAAMGINYWQSRQNMSPISANLTQTQRRIIAITMIGATMPCVKVAFEHLTNLGYEPIIFSAVGPGGRLMEKLIGEGKIAGVLDITLMELSCEYLGGNLTAGPERLEQASLTGTPQVVSLGGLDVISTGPYDDVFHKYPNRKLYRHNEQVTAIRTTPEENEKMGIIIAEKLNKAKGPTALFIPKYGLTYGSKPGGPFYDPEADKALFDTLKAHLNPHVVQIIHREEDLNNENFAVAMADTLHSYIISAGNQNKGIIDHIH